MLLHSERQMSQMSKLWGYRLRVFHHCHFSNAFAANVIGNKYLKGWATGVTSYKLQMIQIPYSSHSDQIMHTALQDAECILHDSMGSPNLHETTTDIKLSCWSNRCRIRVLSNTVTLHFLAWWMSTCMAPNIGQCVSKLTATSESFRH